MFQYLRVPERIDWFYQAYVGKYVSKTYEYACHDVFQILYRILTECIPDNKFSDADEMTIEEFEMRNMFKVLPNLGAQCWYHMNGGGLLDKIASTINWLKTAGVELIVAIMPDSLKEGVANFFHSIDETVWRDCSFNRTFNS